MKSSSRALGAIVGILVAVCSGCAPPAVPPGPIDLVVEALSIYATMPDAGGERQVTASFRIVNRGTATAPASIAHVQSADGATIIGTPALARGASAFFASTAITTSVSFTVTVQADVANQIQEVSESNNTASYDFLGTGASVGRWRPIGPSKIVLGSGRIRGVGRITTIAVDPFSTNVVYAGARGTGLWKTLDGGAHWQPLTDALPTVNVNAVAVDPTNPARVYIATPSGIFASLDGGRSWTMLNGQDLKGFGNDGGQFIVHPTDPRRLYLTTRQGLRISQDGGVTWGAAVLAADGIIQSLAPGRSDPNVLFATVVQSPSAGVWVTDDGGLTAASWRKLQGCAEGPIPAIPATGVGAWVTRSGVTQWLSIKNGTSHELWRTSSRACVVNGRFERVWEQLSSGDQVPCITKDPNRRSSWSFLFADPNDNKILYKGGTNLCRSTDGGEHFQAVDPDNIHVDHHALVFHPTSSGVILLGNDGGLYRSDTRGDQWAFKAEGLSVTEFLDIGVVGATPRRVSGGSQDNGLSSTDEASPIWHDVNLGSDRDGDRTLVVVDPLDADVQFTFGQAVDHFSRVKGGHRDEGFDGSHMPTGCLTYDETPTLSSELIATSSRDWHLLTTPGVGQGCTGGTGLWTGPPWRALFAPPGETFMRVLHDPGEGLFLAGGNQGSIYVNFSPDFMTKVFAAPGSVTSIVRDLAKPASYFIALNTANNTSGRVFEISPEAPLRFKGQDITANLPPTVVMTLAFNRFEPDALYAGTRGSGVFRGVRNAAGQWTWQPFNNGIPQGAIVTKLKVNGALGTIYASTWGRGAFATDTVSIF